MSNVVDFFSKRSMDKLGTPQDVAANASEAEQLGKYVGVLPKGEAKVMRESTEQIRQKREQVTALMQEYAGLLDGYGHMLLGAMLTLGIDPEKFRPDEYDLYVDKDGHCWIVSIEERERMSK